MEMTLIVMLSTALFATIGILGGAVFGFRGQISGVHAEIGKARGEITGLATHADIATLDTSLRGEIAGLATHADIARLEERFGHLEARLDEHLRVHV